MYKRQIGYQQTEEYVELLDFGGQFGELDSRPVQKLADRPIHLAAVSYTHLDVYKRQAVWRFGRMGGRQVLKQAVQIGLAA